MSKQILNGDNFASFFTDRQIICQTSIADRDDLVMEMLTLLAMTRGIGNVQDIYSRVMEHNAGDTTVIGNGIAIPHARIDNIKEPMVAIATSVDGIRFAHDSDLSHLIILVLVPNDQPATYLRILSALGRILQDKDVATSAAELTEAKDIEKFFHRGGMLLPDYVCAADIMLPPETTLHETHSLKDAIDLFVARDLTEIPVIDKADELTGVVTAEALLRVCLPDYILWMDDLSPILHFEPFIDILRKEENTWLAEISTDTYACVQVSEPAIAVAEAMARYKTSVCYVLHDKKLAGTITLPHFLNKIMRY